MEYIINAITGAVKIILSLDSEFLGIVFTSLRISLTSTFLAAVLGIPFGLWVGTGKFKGKNFLQAVLNTLMSLPTVVVGLTLYSFLSRKGPLGNLGILFTPTAMVIGQLILAFPIIAAFTAAGTKNLGEVPLVAARLLGANKFRSSLLFFNEAKLIIITSTLAGFGRVFAEVGVSMMLGGNIRFYTRNITTAIALETSRGEFALGIALGIVLISVAFLVNIAVFQFQRRKS
ncbi:MAG: ABC transporter permease [Candidatus Omnitrophota bacterium]|nr:MAG: ABC transporter permease [Candidatus Omnitrophota bacterium]